MQTSDQKRIVALEKRIAELEARLAGVEARPIPQPVIPFNPMKPGRGGSTPWVNPWPNVPFYNTCEQPGTVKISG
jgi:hypothetical protein